MKTIRLHTISFFLVLCTMALSGCMLEAPAELGEMCPPGTLRHAGDEQYVSLKSLDCYADHVVIDNPPIGAIDHCSDCESDGNRLFCTDLSKSCQNYLSESLRESFDNCQKYRAHGIFNEDGGQNTIGYVHDFENKPVDMSEAGVSEATRYCPLEYSKCAYSALDPSESEGTDASWFGCQQPCTSPLLYCMDAHGQAACIDPETNRKHCGAKGGCFNDSPNSPDWRGAECVGGSCTNGTCDCPEGYGHCTAEADGRCYNIQNDAYHCGEKCDTCHGEEICLKGVCTPNNCEIECNGDNGCIPNTDKQCGPSCMNCYEILALKSSDDNSVTCEVDTGICLISACEEGYHIAYDTDQKHQICKPNTATECAPATLADGETIDTPNRIQDCTQLPNIVSAFCNLRGECEISECIQGYIIGDYGCVKDECDGICGKNETCMDGVCKCRHNYTNCGKEIGCVDIIHDKEHCGGCGPEDVCDLDNEYSAYICDHGECLIDSCAEGYHKYQNACEEDTEETCGSHDADCTAIEHTTGEVSCVSGKCIYTCEEGYHAYETEEGVPICEPNDNENCREHGEKCDYPFNDGMRCDNVEGCILEKCVPEYHVHANECEPDTVENCGAHGITCVENSVCESAQCRCADNFYNCGQGGTDLCVNLMSTHAHCGECGHKCPDDAVCNNNQCACTDAANTYCSEFNACYNLQNDDAHCGSCNTKCGGNEKCCNGVCKNITLDGNCGGCGVTCQHQTKCIDRSCKCASNEKLCGENCTSIETNNNCGNCGVVCKDGSNCSNRTCKCPNSGDGYCDEQCVSLNTKDNCGSCGKKCPGTQQCYNGNCGCPSNNHLYGDNCEVNDNNNCGSHGNSCVVSNASYSCNNGSCTYTCNNGYHKHGGGCEINDVNNCGSHGRSCYVANANYSCNGTSCSFSCNSGFHEYNGGCEANDSNNCGSHGRSCYVANANYWCNGTTCGFTCNPGYTDAGGWCNLACPTGYTGSSCSECAPGFTSCGTNYYDSTKPFCINMNEPPGKAHISFCEDYCNHAKQWGGYWKNGVGYYYVTRCQPGQTCYLNSFNKGEYVQCTW